MLAYAEQQRLARQLRAFDRASRRASRAARRQRRASRRALRLRALAVSLWNLSELRIAGLRLEALILHTRPGDESGNSPGASPGRQPPSSWHHP
jgi:hypothetical protein